MRLRRRSIVANPFLAGGDGDRLERQERRRTREVNEDQFRGLASASHSQKYREEARRLRDEAGLPAEPDLGRDLEELADWYEALAEAAEKRDQRREDAASRYRSGKTSPPAGEVQRRWFSRRGGG